MDTGQGRTVSEAVEMALVITCLEKLDLGNNSIHSNDWIACLQRGLAAMTPQFWCCRGIA